MEMQHQPLPRVRSSMNRDPKLRSCIVYILIFWKTIAGNVLMAANSIHPAKRAAKDLDYKRSGAYFRSIGDIS
jgi:hypothetical protein